MEALALIEHHEEEEDHEDERRIMTLRAGNFYGPIFAAAARRVPAGTNAAKALARLGATDCPTPEEVFEGFDIDGSMTLNATELPLTAAALSVMEVSGCEPEHEECEEGEVTAATWLAAIGTSVGISLTSILAIVLFPCLNIKNGKPTNTLALNVMIAFAIGALVGDALIHILPEVYGVHGHGEEDHDEHEEGLEAHVVPATLAAFGVLIFFLLDKYLHTLLGDDGHEHVYPAVASNPEVAAQADEKAEEKKDDPAGDVTDPAKIHAFGILNLVGDGLHNLIDGLALGASFAGSTTLGLTTAIAIIFHEVPQELGDFSVLLRAGFDIKRALFWNLMSALGAVVGTVIGLLIGGSSEGAVTVMLALTAGSFLYIALGSLLPVLLTTARAQKETIWYTIGVTMGIIAMVIIAATESHAEECEHHDEE